MNEDIITQEVKPTPKKKKWLIWLILICLLIILIFFGRKIETAEKKNQPAPPAVPVYATAAKIGDIKVYLNGLGSVVPINSVVLKSQVEGQLMSVHFKEGQVVNKGDLLAEIDPRPFEATIKQAQGQLIKDKASQDNAKVQYESYKTMVKQNAIDQLDYFQKEAAFYQAAGQVEYDQGVLDNAQLQLTYSKITAPISGIAGFLNIDPGNIVAVDASQGITSINQLKPIYVVFSLPEDNLPSVLAKFDKKETLSVDAFNRNDTAKITSGTLTSIDNQISSTTGTIQLKATFANDNKELYPNQFVNAHLLLDI